MAANREGVVEKRRNRSLQVGASSPRAIVLLIFSMWVLLVLSQLSLSPAVHEKTFQLAKSLPTKARFFNTAEPIPAPPSQAPVVDNGGDPDKIYEDDKRIIHTGPNPLHN